MQFNFFLSDELHQNQLLINELQKKLAQELNRNSKTKKSNMSGTNGDTFENADSDPYGSTKHNEELELKIRQIDNLKE